MLTSIRIFIRNSKEKHLYNKCKSTKFFEEVCRNTEYFSNISLSIYTLGILGTYLHTTVAFMSGAQSSHLVVQTGLGWQLWTAVSRGKADISFISVLDCLAASFIHSRPRVDMITYIVVLMYVTLSGWQVIEFCKTHSTVAAYFLQNST